MKKSSDIFIRLLLRLSFITILFAVYNFVVFEPMYESRQEVQEFRCLECQAEIDTGAKFCYICGTEVPAIDESLCQSCGLQLEETFNWCPTCGTAKSMTEVQEAAIASTAMQSALLAVLLTYIVFNGVISTVENYIVAAVHVLRNKK